MTIDRRITSPVDADDLRVERIAAQLEEAAQQRLTNYWIEEATRARTTAGVGPRPAPKINHRSAAKCVEGAVGASTHEPMTYDFPEIYMAKHPFERPSHPQRVPAAPPPSSTSAPEGMENTRALARRYLPDAVRLLASIAFAPDSEAALHTRMLCAKEIVAIAGVIPQATPALPPYEGAGDSSEPD